VEGIIGIWVVVWGVGVWLLERCRRGFLSLGLSRWDMMGDDETTRYGIHLFWALDYYYCIRNVFGCMKWERYSWFSMAFCFVAWVGCCFLLLFLSLSIQLLYYYHTLKSFFGISLSLSLCVCVCVCVCVCGDCTMTRHTTSNRTGAGLFRGVPT
jgi:hypothetical protein